MSGKDRDPDKDNDSNSDKVPHEDPDRNEEPDRDQSGSSFLSRSTDSAESEGSRLFGRKKIQNFSDFIVATKKIPSVLALVWSANPRLALVFTLEQTISGLTPLASVWVMKTLVDSIPVMLKLQKTSGTVTLESLPVNIFFALLVLSFCWLSNQISQPITAYCRDQITDHLSKKINLMIMDKVDSIIDITVLENPKFYDRLQHLQNDLSYRPIQMLSTCSNTIRFGISFLSLSWLIASLNPVLLLIILLFTTPNIVQQLKHVYEFWEVIIGDVPEVRRMHYFSKVVTNNLDGKEIRLFGLGNFFREQYIETFDNYQQNRRKLRRSQLVRNTMLAFIAVPGTVLCYLYTIYQALQEKISIGSMTMYLGAIEQIESQLTELAFLLAELYRHTLFVGELFEFMEIQPSIIALPKGNEVPVPLPIQSGIEFRNVSFKYPDSDRLILNGVSFKISAGQTVALVGENGAGKTTIVKLLSRLYDPSEGEILIDGIDLRKFDAAEWRRNLAVVFQDYCKYQLTVRENIGIGQVEELNNFELIQDAASRGGAAAVVAKLDQGYATMLGKAFGKDAVGVELSGGEWQKIALSRAFMRSSRTESKASKENPIETSAHDQSDSLKRADDARRAQLLILDEPTASLDVQSESEVYSRFHELTADTMGLLITHRFSTVRMADKILVLEKGKVIEEGTHNELIGIDSVYSSLYNLQAERYK